MFVMIKCYVCDDDDDDYHIMKNTGAPPAARGAAGATWGAMETSAAGAAK